MHTHTYYIHSTHTDIHLIYKYTYKPITYKHKQYSIFITHTHTHIWCTYIPEKKACGVACLISCETIFQTSTG